MSILVDLLRCFKDKPENIATRGLDSVLKKREALSGMNSFLESRFNWPLVIEGIRAQVAQGSDGQPDLEGKDANGQKIFFGEVKFGAPLTDNQPIGYLKRVAPSGLLLFIAPKYRRGSLWNKVKERLEKAKQDQEITSFEEVSAGLIKVDGKFLAISTGSDLLKALLEANRQDAEASCDIRQLQALWEAFDTPDLPLVDEATSADQRLASIILGLPKLPDKIAHSVGLPADARAGRSVSTRDYTYVNLQIRQLKGWVIYSPPNWKEYGCSPIWFETRNNAEFLLPTTTWPVVQHAFAQFAGRMEPFASKSSVDFSDAIAVPLRIAHNAIEVEVIADIVEKLCLLADAIENGPDPEPVT